MYYHSGFEWVHNELIWAVFDLARSVKIQDLTSAICDDSAMILADEALSSLSSTSFEINARQIQDCLDCDSPNHSVMPTPLTMLASLSLS